MPETRTQRAVRFANEHPVATGAGAIGAGVVGMKYGNLARTGLALRALKQPGRAAKLSRDLAGQQGIGLGEGGGGPAAALRLQAAQQKVYRSAVKTNKDTKKLAPTATRWSKDFRSNRRIKQQNPDAPIRARNVLLHPTRTQAHLDSKVLRTMVKESDVNPRTLYRSHPKGKKMGGLTSFSDDKDTVKTFRQLKDVQTAIIPERAHGFLGLDKDPTHIVQVRPGKMRAVNIGPATPRFAQREWVGEPVGKSAFGVRHG